MPEASDRPKLTNPLPPEIERLSDELRHSAKGLTRSEEIELLKCFVDDNIRAARFAEKFVKMLLESGACEYEARKAATLARDLIDNVGFPAVGREATGSA